MSLISVTVKIAAMQTKLADLMSIVLSLNSVGSAVITAIMKMPTAKNG